MHKNRPFVENAGAVPIFRCETGKIVEKIFEIPP